MSWNVSEYLAMGCLEESWNAWKCLGRFRTDFYCEKLCFRKQEGFRTDFDPILSVLEPPGASGEPLGASWGPSLGRLGASGEPFGELLGGPGELLGHLGAVLGPFSSEMNF